MSHKIMGTCTTKPTFQEQENLPKTFLFNHGRVDADEFDIRMDRLLHMAKIADLVTWMNHFHRALQYTLSEPLFEKYSELITLLSAHIKLRQTTHVQLS